jgi:hypothetical protein
VGKQRGTAEWFAGASRLENLQGGRTAAATAENTQSPERQNLQASASYVTGSHTIKVGMQYQWGDFMHSVDANADLTQQYRSPVGTPKWSVPDSVIVRNTPLIYGERLNRDVGIYAQDSWKLQRLTINAGIRWENVVAQVHAGASPAGRWAPERRFEEIKNVPNWKDWAPRFSTVFDLFGTGRTALKYSLNRYNQSRTTGIAAAYNPLASVTSSSLPWRDLDGDDVAEGFRNFNANGTVTNCVFQTPGCEIDLTNLPPNFGVVALNEYGAYPRTWNLESALELQHEVTRGLSGSASWFRGNFHNLTTTINRSYTHADYTPYTFYDPLTGEPIEVYARTLQNRPTSNLDTYDPERERIYESFNFDFNARPGRGVTLFGGLAVERQLDVTCTAPDDPNTLRFCDDRENGIPYRKSFKLSASAPIIWGVNASVVFQSNHGLASSRTMVPTRGVTRYPTSCPAPCPAGQIIMPTTAFGQTSMTVNLVDGDTVYTDRINQLDLRFGRTFEMGRARITPSLEIFNSTNTDAIVSYASTNALNAGSSYLRPNSIIQPRMIGFTILTRW